MSIVFSALAPAAPENYLSEKLKACRMNLSAGQIEQLRQSIGTNHLPLAADGELPTFTAAQNNVVEIYKQQVLDNLSEMLPLVAGESVEATSFSLLTNDYQESAANTPVVTVASNFSTLNYLFDGYRVENGVLKEITPSAPPPPGAALNPVVVTTVADIPDGIGDLIGELATAVAGDGLSWVVSKILDAIAGDFFKSKEVQQLEQYVKQAIEDDTISKARERLHAVLEWMCNIYNPQTTSWNALNTQLQILTEDVLPVLPQYIAALPVHAVAANSALLIAQRMDELEPSQKMFASYAPRYINEQTQLLRDAFNLRAGYVTLTSNTSGYSVAYIDNLHYQVGPFFNYAPCKQSEYDAVTLRAEYSRLSYIWDTLYPEFSTTYKTCMDSVAAWCQENNQAAPRFDYGDRLCGITNDYLAQGMGLVSAQKKYCLLYYRPEKINEPYDDNTAKLVVFSVADGAPRWKSNGSAQGWRAYMQQDRNFVVYGDVPDQWKQADTNDNKNIWDTYPVEKSDQYNSPNSSSVFSSNTGEGGVPPLNYNLVLQDDGTLGIFPDGSPDLVWAAD